MMSYNNISLYLKVALSYLSNNNNRVDMLIRNGNLNLVSTNKDWKESQGVNKILNQFCINSPYSRNTLDRNAGSFHKVLSDSLRQATVKVLDKVLTEDVGGEVRMTISFKLIGIPSDSRVVPKGKISDNLSSDPSMRFKIVLFTPTVD